MLKKLLTLNKKLNATKDSINFQNFMFGLELKSWTTQCYVAERIDKRLAMNFSINHDSLIDKNYDIWMPNKGIYVVKLESGIGFLEVTKAEKAGDPSVSTIYVPFWRRQALLDEIKGMLPIYVDSTWITMRTGKRHTQDVLSGDFGKHEQFVKKEVYDNVDGVFKSMLEGPEKYQARRKAFKETILLYGPPGTGKSTLARHFASKYGCDITVTKPDQIDTLDTNRRIGEKPLIILMEDFDSATFLCKEKPEGAFMSESLIDYGDFINWLDGIQPLNNVIIFLSTNHLEKIIESVHRGGRVDRKVLMDRLSNEEICSFIDEMWQDHVSTLSEGALTISMIPDLRECKTVEEFNETVTLLT